MPKGGKSQITGLYCIRLCTLRMSVRIRQHTARTAIQLPPCSGPPPCRKARHFGFRAFRALLPVRGQSRRIAIACVCSVRPSSTPRTPNASRRTGTRCGREPLARWIGLGEPCRPRRSACDREQLVDGSEQCWSRTPKNRGALDQM